LLIPDGVSQQSPAPGMLCFPGSADSKELLAGEPALGAAAFPDDAKSLDERMAYHYARRGVVAVAFDSPATNETDSPLCARPALALQAIWMGRSYESISVFQKARVLEWLSRQTFVDARRIAASGHSLGSKPADILGVLYPELIRAVVHNDFVCNWQERAVAMNLADRGAHQVLPGMPQWFDYTDLEASLAPRPLLFTEGGRPNQIAKIRRAYELWDAAAAMQLFQYEKYADAKSRTLDDAELPVGITMEQYFTHAYVDPAQHRFHPQHAVPWLARVFGI
jgi:dienelactone hydrolase